MQGKIIPWYYKPKEKNINILKSDYVLSIDLGRVALSSGGNHVYFTCCLALLSLEIL